MPIIQRFRRSSVSVASSVSLASSRRGFVFLLSVLVIGAIVMGMVLSLVLLGIAAEQNSLAVAQGVQAHEYALTCAERGLRNLRSDLSYDGGETVTFADGGCGVAHTGGSGNTNRALCLQGWSGRSTRRIEIMIREVYPRVKIASWKEVSVFTLCP